MTRKITTIALGLLALSALLLTVAPSPDAQAQDDDNCEYNTFVTAACGGSTYPANGFTPQSTPVPTATPGPTSAAVVSADAVQATSSSGSAAASDLPSIAFTGAESRVLGYAGAGLIGLGAVALVIARRQTDTDLD